MDVIFLLRLTIKVNYLCFWLNVNHVEARKIVYTMEYFIKIACIIFKHVLSKSVKWNLKFMTILIETLTWDCNKMILSCGVFAYNTDVDGDTSFRL